MKNETTQSIEEEILECVSTTQFLHEAQQRFNMAAKTKAIVLGLYSVPVLLKSTTQAGEVICIVVDPNEDTELDVSLDVFFKYKCSHLQSNDIKMACVARSQWICLETTRSKCNYLLHKVKDAVGVRSEACL